MVEILRADVGADSTDRPIVQLGDMLKALPLPLADAYLLEQFAGATLDQIDAMDFHRLARALETQRMRDVEGKRKLYLDGKAPDGLLTPDDWRMIADMDRIAGITTDG